MNKNFDPYDPNKKREVHPEADQKNFLDLRKEKLVLRCGARKKKKEGFCKSLAGSGTDHPGYGRCKFCGGNNKGPQTKEGLERSAQNSRKHGLYAKHLTPDEQAIYEELQKKKDLTLTEEISFLKTKLTSYLRWVWVQERARGKKGLIRYKYKGDTVTQYEMGSIEDPNVHKTLEQIRRLVATAKAIDETNEHTLLEQINAELRAASHKESQQTWASSQPQQRCDVSE